jgi:hypothetical protein
MQYDFKAALSIPTLNNILREIETAKEAGQFIYVLEYLYMGFTLDKIKSALKGYPHTHTQIKGGCSGSEYINEVLKALNITPKVLKLCGVNTDQCVAATANDFAMDNPSIEVQVILDACNTDSGSIELGYPPCWKFNKVENLVLMANPERLYVPLVV